MLSQPAGDGTPAVDIATLLSSGDDPNRNTLRASTLVSELLPALDAYTFPVRPGSGAVNWMFDDDGALLVAHDPEWFDAEQAVKVVRLVIGRRITLVEAVAQ